MATYKIDARASTLHVRSEGDYNIWVLQDIKSHRIQVDSLKIIRWFSMHGCEFSPWLSMMFCRLAKVLAYHGSKVAVHDESLMYTYVGYQAAFRAIF